MRQNRPSDSCLVCLVRLHHAHALALGTNDLDDAPRRALGLFARRVTSERDAQAALGDLRTDANGLEHG